MYCGNGFGARADHPFSFLMSLPERCAATVRAINYVFGIQLYCVTGQEPGPTNDVNSARTVPTYIRMQTDTSRTGLCLGADKLNSQLTNKLQCWEPGQSGGGWDLGVPASPYDRFVVNTSDASATGAAKAAAKETCDAAAAEMLAAIEAATTQDSDGWARGISFKCPKGRNRAMVGLQQVMNHGGRSLPGAERAADQAQLQMV